MNILAIDYGTKVIGLAYTINGIIFTLPSINNNKDTFKEIISIVKLYSIKKIYVGISEGKIVAQIYQFVADIRSMLELPVETVEEAVSTIEATQIYLHNGKNKSKLKDNIDSVAAAVILRRVIN